MGYWTAGKLTDLSFLVHGGISKMLFGVLNSYVGLGLNRLDAIGSKYHVLSFAQLDLPIGKNKGNNLKSVWRKINKGFNTVSFGKASQHANLVKLQCKYCDATHLHRDVFKIFSKALLTNFSHIVHASSELTTETHWREKIFNYLVLYYLLLYVH